MDDRIRIGVSKCLLGAEVRWDGGHKRDGFLVGTFGRYVEWVPVCPEVESGLPIPRETLRLVRSPKGGVTVNGVLVRMIFPRSGGDWTDEMAGWAQMRTRQLESERIDGYILKQDSPSCGMARVKVYGDDGPSERVGRGLFAEALVRRFPDLPVEDEGRLNDPRLRENFVERVFAYHRLTALFRGRWTIGGLVRFHAAAKLALLAHRPAAYRSLGALVARAKALPRDAVKVRYAREFMKAMAVVATPARHANVLLHVLRHLRRSIDTPAREEMLGLIDEYRHGDVPLVVPLTLLRHYVKRHRVEDLQGQTYLEPHPRELALRNHV